MCSHLQKDKKAKDDDINNQKKIQNRKQIKVFNKRKKAVEK